MENHGRQIQRGKADAGNSSKDSSAGKDMNKSDDDQKARGLSPEVEAALASKQQASLPEGYSLDVFPIMDNSAIYDSGILMHDEVLIEYYRVNVYTTYSLKEIIDFYTNPENIGEIRSWSADTAYQNGFELGGYIKDYSYYIVGWTETVMDVELSYYKLLLYPDW